MEIKCYNQGLFFPFLFLSFFFERDKKHTAIVKHSPAHYWMDMTWFRSPRPEEIVNQALGKPLKTLFLQEEGYEEMRSQMTEATLATIRWPIRRWSWHTWKDQSNLESEPWLCGLLNQPLCNPYTFLLLRVKWDSRVSLLKWVWTGIFLSSSMVTQWSWVDAKSYEQGHPYGTTPRGSFMLTSL